MHPHIILIVRNLVLFIASFGISVLWAPFLIRFVYKVKAWKKKPREETFGGHKTPIFTKFHAEKEVTTPRMGGIIIWGTVALVILGVALGSWLFPASSFFKNLNFLSRSQTWLPLFALL